jgi:integrase
VRRAKNGTPSVHPIRGEKIRALRRPRRENPTDGHVFVSERGEPMTTVGFHKLISRLGVVAGMPFPIHPHMLRHAFKPDREDTCSGVAYRLPASIWPTNDLEIPRHVTSTALWC